MVSLSVVSPPPRHPNTPETFFPLDQLSTPAFSPSESYTAQMNVPKNEGDDSFAKFSFSAQLRRGLRWAKAADDFFIARWAPNSDSINTPPEGNISPTVRAASVPSGATSDPASISFGDLASRLALMDQRLSGNSRLDPVELQLQNPADSGPSVLADRAASLFAISARRYRTPAGPLVLRVPFPAIYKRGR